jgi:hypothetical protein
MNNPKPIGSVIARAAGNKSLNKLNSNSSKAEPHLKNIKAITHDGVNAEAYWSFDGYKTSLQLLLTSFVYSVNYNFSSL